MNYIEFVKDHHIGIKKGEKRKVTKTVMLKFTEEKFAKEISEKEYNEYVDSLRKDEAKRAAKMTGDPKKEEKPKDPKQEKIYHSLVKLDLDASEILGKQGLKVGDEVEVDGKGLIIVDDKGNATLKPTEGENA